MLTDLNPTKLRNEHLTRPALVYVRQSTLIQVRDNTASAARQYQLAKRAQDLGWPEPLVVVIDQDQGRSGASSTGRDGFEYLIAEVGLGRAGAVLCLEASRLARSSGDCCHCPSTTTGGWSVGGKLVRRTRACGSGPGSS